MRSIESSSYLGLFASLWADHVGHIPHDNCASAAAASQLLLAADAAANRLNLHLQLYAHDNIFCDQDQLRPALHLHPLSMQRMAGSAKQGSLFNVGQWTKPRAVVALIPTTGHREVDEKRKQ